MKEKAPRAKWPKYLIIPSPDDFGHGRWVSYGPEDGDEEGATAEDRDLSAAADRMASMPSLVSTREREALKYSCDTQCCLVGWAALAMGEKGSQPDFIENPATAKFLNKFIEFAGYKPLEQRGGETMPDFIARVAHTASDIFEDRDSQSPYKCVPVTDAMDPKQAHKLWLLTAEHFGYDVDNEI